MRRTVSLLCFFLFVYASMSAQTGKVFDNLSVESKILNSDRKYALYLPPDYESSERSYPVLYLLHGAGDDQTGWVQFGEVSRIADQAIKDGSATPMIIVMPDARTGQMGYFNSIKGDWRYEDFFFEELIPHIEKTFRAKSAKEFRAVAGLSMGGGGSFMYALHHPELFSAACPLSAYIGPDNIEQLNRFSREEMKDISDKDRKEYLKQHNALMLIKDMDPKELNSVRWYIDCGDDDFLYKGNSEIHIAMRDKQVKHEFRIRDGGHSWSYWRSALPVVLEFVTQSFHR